MIRFQRKLSEPLKYGALIIAGSLYIWAIIILLENDNWVGISALTTMLLAIAAFWAIWQNYNFRREANRRERKVRAAEELRKWSEESLRLFYLPYNYNKEEIYNGLSELIGKSVAMIAASTIVGHEFFQIAKKAEESLRNYYAAIQVRRDEHKKIAKSVLEEFQTSFDGLQFYISLLRIWDYDYDAFIKQARSYNALPLYKHLKPSDFQ